MFDHKLKAVGAREEPIWGFVFFLKKKKSWGEGRGRGHPERPDSDFEAASG